VKTIFISLIFFSGLVFSDDTPVLGIAVNFDCPHCKTVFEARSSIESHCGGGLNKQLCKVVFLPFPNEISDYRAKAYYIAKDISLDLAIDVSDIFYDYNPKGSLRKEEVVTLLSTLAPSHEWGEILAGETERKGTDSLFKVAKLFRQLKITDTPTFVWVDSTNARIIPTVHDPRKRLDSVIAYLGKRT
jgi:hypothetical protein